MFTDNNQVGSLIRNKYWDEHMLACMARACMMAILDDQGRALLWPLNAFVSSSKLHTKSAPSAGLAWSIEL